MSKSLGMPSLWTATETDSKANVYNWWTSTHEDTHTLILNMSKLLILDWQLMRCWARLHPLFCFSCTTLLYIMLSQYHFFQYTLSCCQWQPRTPHYQCSSPTISTLIYTHFSLTHFTASSLLPATSQTHTYFLQVSFQLIFTNEHTFTTHCIPFYPNIYSSVTHFALPGTYPPIGYALMHFHHLPLSFPAETITLSPLQQETCFMSLYYTWTSYHLV